MPNGKLRKEPIEKDEQERLGRDKREKHSGKWERRRAAAATGITGVIGCSYKVPMIVMAVICPGVSIVLCYIIATVFQFKWIISFAPLVGVGSLILAYHLWELADKRVKEHQLRKFDKNNPPPSKDAKEEMGDNAV